MSRPIRIGITAGDMNGIGPEVILKALHGAAWPGDQRAIIIGDHGIMGKQCRKFRLPCPSMWDPAESVIPDDPVVVWNPWPGRDLDWRPGKLSAGMSAAAAEWIRFGTQACLDGVLDALVTAPISKEGFQKAGIHFPGHTEMLADLTGTNRFAMMLFGGPLRVVLATRHIPLSSVPGHITKTLIKETVAITHEGLEWMGLRRRRIAVCGLNPHAGEGGNIGREEVSVIAPAVRELRKKGLDVHGPLSGDTVFYHAASGMYDAVIAMYHDQGLAPLKLAAFESGVNLTLGLPIVRTSPDHGTAYAIAGKNIANPSSMAEAIVQARLLARRKNPWVRGTGMSSPRTS
jgi:4-hydroxythreonine-4-phosphate dehydrogenase